MIYLDNSATTNPKPKSVINAVTMAMNYYSFNSGRGGYNGSVKTSEMIYNVRGKASKLFSLEPQNICFTNNCTTALNMAIKGLIKNGDHILISNLEHNAVARPVYTLALKGMISYDTFEYSYDDEEIINNIESLIKPNTSAIVCTQASNVFGCVLPINEIGELARKHSIKLIVDGAQGAGIVNTNCSKLGIDAYCVAGHKGLYGPMSTGILALNNGTCIDTIIEGGTGSDSAVLTQPKALPDTIECGSLSNSSIIGLGAGIDFLKQKGINNIYKHELELAQFVYSELSKNPNIVLYTPMPTYNKWVPIISFNAYDYSSEKTASILAKKGVAVRGGLHCAPMAHRAFKTVDRGTVRFSPSVFTSLRECEKFCSLLKKL